MHITGIEKYELQLEETNKLHSWTIIYNKQIVVNKSDMNEHL